MILLRCTSGPLSGECIELKPEDRYILGREPETNDDEGLPILLGSKTVSRKHCQIEFDGQNFVVRDLNSSNGLRLNRQRVEQGELHPKDILQIGEFTFVVESPLENTSRTSKKIPNPAAFSSSSLSTTAIEPQTATPLTSGHIKKVELAKFAPAAKVFWQKFEKIDLRYRTLILLILGALVVDWLITTPMISDARTNLLHESFEIGRKAVRTLAERNREQLAQRSFFALDCEFVKSTDGVLEAYLLDSRGKSVCPIATNLASDELTESALMRGETIDNCKQQITEGGGSSCDLVFPIRESSRDKEGQFTIVGVARIRYTPKDAQIAVQNLQTLSWKTFFLTLLVLAGVWWLSQRWLARALTNTAEAVHLAVVGTVQNVDKSESFAALDPILSEVNRLISKSNQGLGNSGPEKTSEASFLHVLLKQVLLMEERAVMIVDKDNHLIAASNALEAAIPVDMGRMDAHITEAITDTHLQGELMAFLNDLSLSSEVLDRALSSQDRVIQARGMPLFMNQEYVASFLIF